mmetsp:Transcript_16057/g.21103  ORF Transcript_16057/g.21103 Transcript_16057/m.21103 type:complete len:156 (+) Transcript_16057:1-468(+)
MQYGAMVSNEVARRASIAQGKAMTRIAKDGLIVEQKYIKLMQLIRQKILGNNDTRGFLAPLFGFVCGLLGIDCLQTQRMYLFTSLRDLISAGIRLTMCKGPIEAVAMQRQISPFIDMLLDDYGNEPNILKAHQSFPMGDILHALHDKLQNKLFFT